MANKTVEERLTQAHFKIMRHPSWCAFAGVVMMGRTEVVPDDHPRVSTACVNARGDRYYNRGFMTPFNDTEFMYIVLHESLHFALSQLIVWKALFEKDPGMVGIAADHVVNNLIDEVEEKATNRIAAMPVDKATGAKIGVCDVKYRGWDLKAVYDDLCSQYGSAEQRKGSMPGKVGRAMDEHDTKGGGPGEELDLTEEEVQGIRKEVDAALRQGEYLAGKMGGNATRALGELLTPKFDWKEELRDFVVSTCVGGETATWKKPMRRFVGMDTYFPSFEDESIGELVIAIDVSGSCWSYTERFMSEVVSIADTVKPKRLRVIQWDVGVTKEQVYELGDLSTVASTFEACGGGGTTVSPVADYVHTLEDVQAAIILTDGDICGSWEGQQGWGCPTLWVLTSGRNLAPCGKTLRLSMSDWGD